jgi:hypothetical protein
MGERPVARTRERMVMSETTTTVYYSGKLKMEIEKSKNIKIRFTTEWEKDKTTQWTSHTATLSFREWDLLRNVMKSECWESSLDPHHAYRPTPNRYSVEKLTEISNAADEYERRLLEEPTGL